MGTTLSFRIGMVMLAGFIVMQVLLLALWQGPGRTGAGDHYGLPAPASLAQMVDAMERAGPIGAERLAETYDGSLFSVRIAAEPPRDHREVPSALLPLARDYRRALAGRDVVVDGGPGPFATLIGDRARPLRFIVPIRLAIRMRGGQVLVLTGRPSSVLSAYLARRSMLGAVGGALLLLVLWLALRQTTRPLIRLTRAVDGLGHDLRTENVRIEGSRETRALARSFNAMQARIASLMEERTFILAGIAHDMRTYLTRLRLRAEYIADEDQRQRAARDLDQMSALLDDNLLFAGIDRGNASSSVHVDLPSLTRDLIDARIDADRIQLHSVNAAAVLADPAGLERIFGNLVDNGLRHAGRMQIAIRHEAGRIVWHFEDDGPGVPAEEIGRLGQAYRRLEPSRNPATGGAGLGLAIVRALAEATGASVSFGHAAIGGLRVEVGFPSGR